jgi:lysophospholipase L1-like esterase
MAENTNSSCENVEDHLNRVTTIVLADSILNGAACNDPSLKLIAKPGYGLHDIKELLNTVMEEKLPDLKTVVISLGSNDVRRTKSAPSTQIQLQDAVETIQNHLPEAEVFISGITPRKGQTKDVIQDCNNIRLVNEYARLLASSKSGVHFISTEGLFKLPHPNALQRYQKDDKLGIHLTKQGRKEVLNCIMQSIRQQQQSTPQSKKRGRSGNQTPQSSEKSSKTQKFESNPNTP